MSFLQGLAGFVNENALGAMLEDLGASINRARLIQGDSSLKSDANLNQTPYYLGGIGLSVENLPEDVMSKASIFKELEHAGNFAVFPELEVVVLAQARIKRLYAEINGENKLACGTNQDGMNGKGWSGQVCKTCPYHKKNMEAAGKDKKDGCTSYVVALIYIPSLNHAAILSVSGKSYMPANDWMQQLKVLSRGLAQHPEFKHLNLPRVNPYFFKTVLKPSGFQPNDDGKMSQVLDFSRAEAPYQWENLVNSAEVIKKASDIWTEIEEAWQSMYTGHNPNAAMSLPTAEAAVQLGTTETKQITTNKVTIPDEPAAPVQQAETALTQPVQQAAAPAVNAEVVADLPVSTIKLDDADDEPVQPVSNVMMF